MPGIWQKHAKKEKRLIVVVHREINTAKLSTFSIRVVLEGG
jgi:formylmethanofuran dehydrogenase subunit B